MQDGPSVGDGPYAAPTSGGRDHPHYARARVCCRIARPAWAGSATPARSRAPLKSAARESAPAHRANRAAEFAGQLRDDIGAQGVHEDASNRAT